MRRFKFALLLFGLPLVLSVATSSRAQGITTNDLFSGVSPQQLVNTLLATGVDAPEVDFDDPASFSFSAFIPSPPIPPELPLQPPPGASIGTFSGGIDIVGADFDGGVILSSGQIKDVVGPNASDFTSTANNLPGDPFLDNLIPGFKTTNASSLEIEFTCPEGDIILITYVFSSDEYNEQVYSGFNDMFAIILDEASNNEQNIALLPNGSPVAIDNVNGGNPLGQNASNADAYINNDPSDGDPPFNFEPDGFTVVLTATGFLEDAGPHRIRFVVADGYPENNAPNNLGDTWVFLRAESLQCAQSIAPSENIAPVALCIDRTVAADPETCVAEVDVNDGSIDPNEGPITLSQSPAGPYKQDDTLVTLTVADDSGASDSCRATVTVVDTTPPRVSCRAMRQNRSGFYRVTSSDCSRTILTIGNRMLANGTTNAETIKLTRTPGKRGIRRVNKNHFLVGSKDVVIKATDTSGNIATATCILPPPPKSQGHSHGSKSRSHRRATKSRSHRHVSKSHGHHR